MGGGWGNSSQRVFSRDKTKSIAKELGRKRNRESGVAREGGGGVGTLASQLHCKD